jgi:hypothetical protein
MACGDCWLPSNFARRRAVCAVRGEDKRQGTAQLSTCERRRRMSMFAVNRTRLRDHCPHLSKARRFTADCNMYNRFIDDRTFTKTTTGIVVMIGSSSASAYASTGRCGSRNEIAELKRRGQDGPAHHCRRELDHSVVAREMGRSRPSQALMSLEVALVSVLNKP